MGPIPILGSMFLIIFYAILLVICTVVLFLVFFFLIAMLVAEVTSWGKPSAPFVPLPEVAVDELVKHISVDANSVIYDLGCGDGRILRALWEKHKMGKYVGVERGLVPYVLARIKTRKIPKGNMKIIRGNIFDIDLKNATHVTTYLFPKLMDAMLPKLEKELRHGTCVYSVDFKFTKKETMESFDLNVPAKTLGRKLFVYQF